jgi:hypothetical protein
MLGSISFSNLLLAPRTALAGFARVLREALTLFLEVLVCLCRRAR